MLYTFCNEGHTNILADGALDGPVKTVLHPSQFKFLSELYRQRPVEVCSITALPDWHDKATITEQLACVTAPAPFGGYRPLGEQELLSLYIANCDPMEEIQDGELREGFLTGLARHPLVKSGISFGFGKNLTIPLIHLMQEVYDVLRFTDTPEQAEDHNFLDYFSMITPEQTARLLKNKELEGPIDKRSALAISGWKDQPFADMSQDQAEACPQAFLFRRFFELYHIFIKTHNDGEAKAMALFRTTQEFLVFVRRLWMHGLGVETFMPEAYFQRDDEVESFLEQINAVDKSVDSTKTEE